MSAELIKYGTAYTFEAPMAKTGSEDFATSSDWTPAAGDVKIRKDGGSWANIGTLPTYSDGIWVWTVSATEAEAARVTIRVIDPATKVVMDNCFRFVTFGHANAYIQADLSAANLPANVAQWNGTAVATPDTAGYPKITIKSGTGTGELSLSSGVAKSNLSQILGTALTETVGGYLAAAFKTFLDVASPVFTAASVNQSADNDTLLQTLDGRLTSSRAGYLDNLNAGGVVASQADVLALNTSASRRTLLVILEDGWEVPESGTVTKSIYLQTYDGDGDPVAADSSPSITIVGSVTGDLSGNLSVISNPSTGVYKWTYTLTAGDTVEDVEILATPTIGSTDFPVRRIIAIADEFGVKWTATHASQLAAIYNKIPSRSYLVGTSNSTGEAQWESAWDAEVQSECNGALVAFAWSGITVGAVSGAVGSVTGAVGSISGITFPTNFSSFDIDVNGKVTLQSNAISAGVMSTDVIGASEFSAAAVNKIAARLIPFFQLIARSDAAIATDNASALTELNASGGSGVGDFDNTTASLEGQSAGGGGDASAANQLAILKLLSADLYLNTSSTPWQIIWRESGTETALLTKDLTQPDGSNVTSADHRIGHQTAP